MTKPQNIHISPGPIVNAGRILKQSLSVARSELFSKVIICGKAREGLPRQERLTYDRLIERVGPSVNGRKSSVFGRVREQVVWAIAVYNRYSRSKVSVVNAHSVAVLPICYLLSRRLKAKLIYDTHELETETFTSTGIQRRIFKTIERILIAKCDAVFVVNESIANWYAERYPGLRPVTIRNIPFIADADRPVDIREMLSVPTGARLFIHVGHLSEGRNIPAILNAFASDTVDAHVVFLGGGQLGALVSEYSANHLNIHHLPPVSPTEVVSYIANCDVGLCLAQLPGLSHKLASPNKAFEYVKAGVPFFFTDLPEVDRLLGPTFNNWRIEDPARDLVSAMTVLSGADIEDAKAKIAKLRLPTWHEEAEEMMATYMDLVSA